MMKSKKNGDVCYLMLQRLAEQAWDQDDQERLALLSEAVDRYAVACIMEKKTERKAV